MAKWEQAGGIDQTISVWVYTHGEVAWEAEASQTPYLALVCEL